MAFLTVKSPVVVVVVVLQMLLENRRKLMTKYGAVFCVCVDVQVTYCVFGHL